MTQRGFTAWATKNRAVIGEQITEKGLVRYNVVTRKGTPRTITIVVEEET